MIAASFVLVAVGYLLIDNSPPHGLGNTAGFLLTMAGATTFVVKFMP